MIFIMLYSTFICHYKTLFQDGLLARQSANKFDSALAHCASMKLRLKMACSLGRVQINLTLLSLTAPLPGGK